MSKSLASIAIALGFAAVTAGSAWACGGMKTAETSVDPFQTASSDTALPQTPKPETKSN